MLELAEAIGFDPLDAGPLKNARSLEALAPLNIQLSWVLGYGPNVGFKFIHEQDHVSVAIAGRKEGFNQDQI